MNSLSWMIYFADISESSGFGLGLMASLGVPATIVMGIVRAIALADKSEDALQAAASLGGILKFAAPISVLCCLLAWTIPGKETIYAIAASEFGEEALKSPEATKARAALNAWLDKQIGDEKPEQQ